MTGQKTGESTREALKDLRDTLSNCVVHKGWQIVVAVIFVTFWSGVRGLNWDALWGDEMLTIYDAGVWTYGPRSPVDIWHQIEEQNPWHAPGYFIIVNLWAQLTGYNVVSLRALSLFL